VTRWSALGLLSAAALPEKTARTSKGRDTVDDLTIWDLEDLDADDAFARAKATLAKFPILERVYDDGFLRDLISRRATLVDNRLLLMLVQPEDDVALSMWQEITNDLMLLAPEGAIAAFGDKLKHHTSAEVEATWTEIALPAWFMRNGTAVVLEPAVGDKRPDFRPSTEPPTTWEIKSLQDIDDVQTVDAVSAGPKLTHSAG
jgi:hypothetical protein